MKSVRFSQVVEKCGKPEVYLLLSETDSDFHKALESGRVMRLSGEAHGSGTEYGTVGYDKKRRGQLLVFPKSLKRFANAKVVGIKYDLLAEEIVGKNENKSSSHAKKKKEAKARKSEPATKTKPDAETRSHNKKAPLKPTAKKVIPFPAKQDVLDEDDDNELKVDVRQAMHALEKGNPVAAYNILKRIIPEH